LKLTPAKTAPKEEKQVPKLKDASDTTKKKIGMTDLMYAAASGQTEKCRLLVGTGKGNDVNAKDNFGWTALMYSAKYGNSETCAFLIKKGADVNAKDSDGNTVLALAKKEKYPEIADLLEKAGAKE
jgi:ankyrin repeat protein